MKTRSKSVTLKHSISLFALVAMLMPSTAFAQVDEIVVTAQKRAESLSDVPVAVTAYTAETLNALNINTADDLIDVTPGLQSAQQGGSNKNFFLRGIGTLDFHLTAASAVGQYFDGITLTSGFHAKAALFDMERVEVLKGPQNTLFGLNTTAGAINYISRKPEIGGGLNGYGKFTYGSDNKIGIDAAAGFDNGEDLAVRLALQTNKHDGPFESITNGIDYGDENFVGGRGTLLWRPMETTDITLNIHGSRNRTNGSGVPGLGTRDPNNPAARCSEFGNFVLDFSTATNCVSRNGNRNGALPVNPSTDGFEAVTQNVGNEDINTSGGYVKIDHDFGFASLVLNAAYDNLNFEATLDGDGGPTTLLHLNQEDDRDTYQYEARLVSPDNNPFRWIAGVYYLDESAESYTGVISPGIGGGHRLPNVQLDHSKENLGIYGQVEYDLTDRLTVTGGLRWSDEELSGDYMPSAPVILDLLNSPIYADTVDRLVRDQFVGNPGFDGNGFEIARQISNTITNKDVGFTGKLDYKLTDDSLVYASVSEGYKGGALDIRAAFALVPTGNLQRSLEVNQLDPESLRAYEVGYKGAFLDNRIRFDIAGFYYDFENLQQFVTATGVPQLTNAPQSEVYGVDGNLRYANDSGFYADLGFSILDGEVTDAGTSVFVEGARLGRMPPYKVSFLASQELDLGDNLLTLTGSVTHTAEHVEATLPGAAINGDLARSTPDLTLVNANAAYSFGENDQYKFSVFANNLTDENFCGQTAISNTNNVVGDAPFAGGLNATAACRTGRNATRTYGASVQVNF